VSIVQLSLLIANWLMATRDAQKWYVSLLRIAARVLVEMSM
jgi:hypothetical protein